MRDWLNANKIYFETVTASLLSLMAIVVSIEQNLTTSQQTELLALQTRIVEAQALPQFEMELRQILNKATGNFDDNHLVISNHGGPVHDFNADVAYFIKTDVERTPAKELKTDIPINGYFTADLISSNSNGVLVTMIGDHNNAMFVTLEHGILAKADAKKLDFALLDEQFVVCLRYKDLMDRQHEDYYEVRPIYGGTRMKDEVGKARFSRWNSAQHIELSTLHVDDLLKYAFHADSSQP